MKKHIIQFFNDLKPIYNNNATNYKNIDINDWSKFFNEFNNKYQKYNDNEIITESFTTTSYRYHEQGLEFGFYKNFIFKIAIPYASKIIFYKIKNKNILFFIPRVDFFAVKNIVFWKAKTKKEKIYNRNIYQQQKWREKIILTYRHCLITNLKCTDVLEAAHIKPFCKCNEQEQFNINNGVLLTSTFHKFFDQGLIFFAEKQVDYYFQ